MKHNFGLFAAGLTSAFCVEQSALAADAARELAVPAQSAPAASTTPAPPAQSVAPAPTTPAPNSAPTPGAAPSETANTPQGDNGAGTPASPPAQPSPPALPAAQPAQPAGSAPAPALRPTLSAFTGYQPSDAEAPGEVPDDGQMGAHQRHFFANAGVRTTLIRSTGFDLFAENDVLAQFSADLGAVLFASGPLSGAASLAWDYGAKSSTARGEPTSLDFHRFTAAPELRYHFLRRLYGFARVGAGVALVETSLGDRVTASTRTRKPALFTLDASAGAAWEVLGTSAGAVRQPRGWLVLDAGYLFTGSTELTYSNSSGSPARSEPIALGSLGLSGITGRVSAVLSL